MYYFCVHIKRNYKISRKISSEIIIESFVFRIHIRDTLGAIRALS